MHHYLQWEVGCSINPKAKVSSSLNRSAPTLLRAFLKGSIEFDSFKHETLTPTCLPPQFQHSVATKNASPNVLSHKWGEFKGDQCLRNLHCKLRFSALTILCGPLSQGLAT